MVRGHNMLPHYPDIHLFQQLKILSSRLLLGVDGYPKEDLVTRLPGQPKVEFSQYAGYVDIDVKHGRSLFYYFVEADHDPQNKPLTLWNSGGPGCSSIGGGAFTELGPFYPNGDGRSLRRNSMSWNKASNLLFVESPAGTANDMLVFILNWYEKFPSYRSKQLIVPYWSKLCRQMKVSLSKQMQTLEEGLKRLQTAYEKAKENTEVIKVLEYELEQTEIFLGNIQDNGDEQLELLRLMVGKDEI